jgi:hypothetical protein
MILKDLEARLKADYAALKAFFPKLYNRAKLLFVKLLQLLWIVFKKLFATLCDEDWDLDVFRLSGLIAGLASIYIALRVCALIGTISEGKLAILAGLITALGVVSTALFSQARKGDDTRLSKK